MSCGNEWHFDTEQLVCTPVQLFRDKTKWVPVCATTSIVAAMRVGTSGNGRGYLGVRYAAVRPDNPVAASTIGSAITGVTEVGRSTTLSAAADYMWAQFGYVYDLSTGSTDVALTIGMDLYLQQCVEVVGARRCGVNPSLTATAGTPDAFVFEIGKFAHGAGLDKLKAGIIARGVLNNDLETMLVYRTALNPAKPGAWQFTLEAGWNTPNSDDNTPNSERCTGELAPSLGTDILVQPGLAVRRKSGGDQVRGDFEIAVYGIR